MNNMFLEEENCIVASNEVDLMEEVPYMVGLRDTQEGSNFCGGVLLSKRHVLTAASCSFSDHEEINGRMQPRGTPEITYVSIGSSDRRGEDDSERIKVKNTLTEFHPNYDRVQKHFNVMTLKRERDVSENYHQFANIQVKDWFPEKKYLPLTKTATTYRWGNVVAHRDLHFDEHLMLKYPSKLRKAKLNLFKVAAYQKWHLYTVYTYMICAGCGVKPTNPKSRAEPCKGDTGSPLICINKVIGIVSSGRKGSCGFSPGVFTRIAAVRTWIESVVNSD